MALANTFDVDAMAGCESMCNWRNAEEDEQFEQFFGLGELRKGTAAHNTSPSEAHIDSLPGGTAAMTLGRLLQYVCVCVTRPPGGVGLCNCMPVLLRSM